MGIIISGTNNVLITDAVTGTTASVTAQGQLQLKDEPLIELLEERSIVNDARGDEYDDEEAQLQPGEDE